ncbi:hypothetical protein QQ008_22330 [Fulvivirgaceae bacterium BMA10]|uniref:Uncharacterized protein n=1 Tax=Splendidivirga corallicola TaxID=3051826 RepID=A0ABT8KTP6_9BACT|nr:hypothetical protein [Fulvivirgaceae bacterium BMA10]
MLKIIFVIVTALHGLIHLLGFVKAFELTNIAQLTQTISKTKGLLWLAAAILFSLTIAIYLLKKDWWWILGIASVAISQILIVMYWQDARSGTIANIIVIIASVLGYGEWKFNKTVTNELASLLPENLTEPKIISPNTISHLPSTVQNWLQFSKVIEKKQVQFVHLFQTGKMRIKPDGKWMKVKAEQWFSTHEPGFLWRASVGEGSFMKFSGMDSYLNGHGNMLIRLYALFPLVNASGSKIDQGVMVRYLSEMIWFPSAALNDYITWQEITPSRVSATMTYNNLTVTGEFNFDDKGRILSFEAQRYFDKTGKLETWFINIDAESYQTFHDRCIPTKAKVTWKLADEDFTWYELEISNVEYE